MKKSPIQSLTYAKFSKINGGNKNRPNKNFLKSKVSYSYDELVETESVHVICVKEDFNIGDITFRIGMLAIAEDFRETLGTRYTCCVEDEDCIFVFETLEECYIYAIEKHAEISHKMSQIACPKPSYGK